MKLYLRKDCAEELKKNKFMQQKSMEFQKCITYEEKVNFMNENPDFVQIIRNFEKLGKIRYEK